MKKRIFALALCLVMAVSLLPVTAAADENLRSWVQGIKPGGTYCGDTYFSVNLPVGLRLLGVQGFTASNVMTPIPEGSDGRYMIPGNSQIVKLSITVEGGPTRPATFSMSINHHDWHFTQTDGILTAKCQNSDCPIGGASVTLKADSVTLPDSPFNARLEGWDQFKAAIPSAEKGEFVYKYKGPGDSEYQVVEPTSANAKAGEYQVGFRITGLPTGAGYADLYVKYTAADPAITAQTGDNRPIELMLAAVVVFSALAAAAFVLDSKRRYHR